MRKVTRFIYGFAPVFVWMLVVFLFSNRPTINTVGIYWQDFILKKTAHIVEYGILATLLFRAFRLNGVSKLDAGYYALGTAFLYAVTDEYHQAFIPGRGPRIRDVIFDTIGAILAVNALWRLLPRLQGKLKTLAEKLQLV